MYGLRVAGSVLCVDGNEKNRKGSGGELLVSWRWTPKFGQPDGVNKLKAEGC